MLEGDTGDRTAVIDVAVGRRIKALRDARKMSQEALGEALAAYGHPLVQPVIARIEAGKRPLRLAEAVALAAVLGVSVTDLVPGGAGDQPARQAALTAVIETSREFSEAVAAAEEAQRRYDEAQQRLDDVQRQAEEAQRELLAANRRRRDALVAAEVAGMRYNSLPPERN
jgi:transcriptional regulator with XRE-family HTH domain